MLPELTLHYCLTIRSLYIVMNVYNKNYVHYKIFGSSRQTYSGITALRAVETS